MVAQNARKYSARFSARIETDLFYDLFSRRLDGERLYINRAMEAQFLFEAESPREHEIAALIREWHFRQIPLIQEELAKQEKRYNDARRTLSSKVTKKAENDLRISTDKIAKLTKELGQHQSFEAVVESDSRIFPFHYAAMVCVDETGERVVRPVRYLMRPHAMDAEFDVKFNGCYNARFDGLESVPWWRDCLGKRHGLLLVSKFFENVNRAAYLKHNPITTPHVHKDNLVVCFEPGNVEYMAVPTVWDRWKSNGTYTLYSAAIITDDPRPEVLRAGHDRTPIVLSSSGAEKWLNSISKSAKDCRTALMDREYPLFGHTLA
jgi:putative SOS response-associated peptidase YedK